MQVSGMSAETIQASMKHESQCKKLCIAISSAIHLVFAGVVGIIWALWWRNVNELQNAAETVNPDIAYNVYDAAPFTLWKLTPVNKQATGWTDYSSASEYGAAIEEECGSYILNSTDSCYLDGNNWSVIYAFCAVTMLLLAVNSGLMIIGAWSFHARGLASCCGSLCCCLNLAAIVTTGVFRFNN